MAFPSIAAHADSPEECFAMILRKPPNKPATLDFEVDADCIQVPIPSQGALDNIIATFLDDEVVGANIFKNMEISSTCEAQEALAFAFETFGINLSQKGRKCRLLAYGIPERKKVKLIVIDSSNSFEMEVDKHLFSECAEEFNRLCSEEKLRKIGFLVPV